MAVAPFAMRAMAEAVDAALAHHVRTRATPLPPPTPLELLLSMHDPDDGFWVAFDVLLLQPSQRIDLLAYVDRWRIAARVNYADTDDRLNPAAGARLAESNLGFAHRPHDNTRYALFGKWTYLLDEASLGQDGGAQYDQRSQVVSLEGVMQLGDRWSVAPKLASRWGDYRLGRGTGTWFDSRADFMAVQLRYHLPKNWDALAEVRQLDVRDGGVRRGGLIGVDRQLGDNFKIGAGYNFTDFSDDLTDLEYDHHGFFLNLAGFY